MLTVEEYGFNGYDYCVKMQDGTTVGYLSHDSQNMWMFSYGSTVEEATMSEPAWYEDYTLNGLMDELKGDLASFYVRYGLPNCRYEEL